MNITNHLICLSRASLPLKRYGIVVLNGTETKSGAAEKLAKQTIGTENACTLSDNALMLVFLSVEHV